MPGLNDSEDIELDAQDRAEAYDETNLSDYGEQRRTFEEMDDVYDATRAADDADVDGDDEALDAGAYDPDDLGDAALEEDEDDVETHMSAERIGAAGFDEDDPGDDSVDGLDQVADAGRVAGGEDDVSNFQSRGLSDRDIDRLGYGASGGEKPDDDAKGSGATADDVEDNRDPAKEKELDNGLKETFPASDPVSISPGAD